MTGYARLSRSSPGAGTGSGTVYDGALVAVPVKDTVKIVTDGVVRETPPRENLWLAQTPQAFSYGVIRAAHEIAEAEGFLGTDDAMLVERLGKDVHIVLGDYRNIKITTPEDLVLAEAFLRGTASVKSPSAARLASGAFSEAGEILLNLNTRGNACASVTVTTSTAWWKGES